MKLAMTAKSIALVLLAGVTILALGMLAGIDTNSATMHVHGFSLLTPTNGRRLSNTTADVVPRQLQDAVQMSSMGGLGDLVSFFENNIMLLWLIVLILGCCGCHTVAHYLSVALYGLSYLDLCLGRRSAMGMGGHPMGGMGGYPMGGMGGNPMGGAGGMGGYPMGDMGGGGYPMGGMDGGNGHQHHQHHQHQHHQLHQHHASGGGSMHVGSGGYHGGFNAQPVHHASYGPAGRQPDGSWKF
mmetsp:Transcript_12524/g.24418  ORF Transcript_12524/g.24418 Transcript_12524/m.24418 type:complete len:241 (-) Transcript_12524:439-1161(-)